MKKTFIWPAIGMSLIGSSVYFRSGLPDPLFVPLFLTGGVIVLWSTFTLLFSGNEEDRPPKDPTKSRAGNADTSSASEISGAVNELRRQISRLSEEMRVFSDLANAGELKNRLDSLQKVLQSSQADLKRSKDLLADERAQRESCELEKERLRTENGRLHDDVRRLQADLKMTVDSREKLVSAESGRLTQMVPPGMVESLVGQTVKWCAEASARGDRVAAQIFASLQSIKAAQEDDELKGLLLSSLDVLGHSLARLSDREGYSPQQKYDVLSNWASVLNEISGSRFTLIVPSIGARLNLNTMVSAGPASGNVTAVHCWGVLNENRDIYSHAKVS